jgi:hypothetical protein
VVLLLRFYYSAQIFLLGAEFIRVVHMNMVRAAHRRACNAFPLHLTLLNGSNRHRESPTASHTVFQAAKVPELQPVNGSSYCGNTQFMTLIHQRTSTSETPSHTDLPTLGGIAADMGIAPTVLRCSPKRLLM